jgi:hypothetical protein
MPELPTVLCDHWTEAQVKAFRLMVNRSVSWAEWNDDLLAQELADLKGLDFDLSLTGFDDREIKDFLSDPELDDRANVVPDPPTRLPFPATCGFVANTGSYVTTPPPPTPPREQPVSLR